SYPTALPGFLPSWLPVVTSRSLKSIRSPWFAFPRGGVSWVFVTVVYEVNTSDTDVVACALGASATAAKTMARRSRAITGSLCPTQLVVASGGSLVNGRRKASRTRTQGGRVPVGTWPTEDAVMRRLAAGRAHNGTCGRGH